MTSSVAFVTKSYAPDLERCELLCRSIDALAPEAGHWIIVDRRDLAAFRVAAEQQNDAARDDGGAAAARPRPEARDLRSRLRRTSG